MASYPTLVVNAGRIQTVQLGDTTLPNPTILNLGSADVTLTIAGGVVTVTSSRCVIETEGAAASDDLDTINGGNIGDIVMVRAANDARTVVVKHGTGNIQLSAATNKSLTNSWDILVLVFQADNNWHQVEFNDGAV